MKKKTCKSSKSTVDNILSHLEVIRSTMEDLEKSASSLSIQEDDVGGPCIECDDKGKLMVSIYFYDAGFFYTVDDIVDRSFEVADDNDDVAEMGLRMKRFRDAFDQAVIRNLKKYAL